MTIHILVEGPSERAFFDRWIPRLALGQDVRVHPHQGKGSLPNIIDAIPDLRRRGLLDQLPAKLRAFADVLKPDADGVLVLLDADNDEVGRLANAITAVARQCAPQLRVSVSIAVEEMEAFFLGDLRALQLAYPAADMQTARSYVPDSICGTWELFGKIVGDGGGNKVAWAEAMGPRLTISPGQNRSPSFRHMVQELRALLPVHQPPAKKRPYRHLAKTRKRNGV